MSVTFYCPEALPVSRDRGDGAISSPRECNFSNVNARNILALLSKRLRLSGPGVGDWPEELYGEWSQASLPEVQRTILQVSNVVGLREWMVTEPVVIQEPGRCTFIETGNTDEMTLRRLRSLSELVAYAAKNNYRICWS
tara:strand:- start:134 stop:550 length:417 start_codon:yes stop_codon:yes gene_type:complete